MREIINIQIGQAGNNIGASFWELILMQHGIDLTGSFKESLGFQMFKIDAFFNESSTGKYIPRAILTDLQPGTIDSIRCNNKMGYLFKAENFIFEQTSASNNWAKGYYTVGSQIIDKVMESIRKQVEICECLQGFQIMHSIGGGTGSGMGSLLIEKIKQQFPDKITQAFSVFPSQKVSDIVVEPYNAILSIRSLIQKADTCMVFDNQALYNINNRNFKIQKPNYADLNRLVSNSMSGVTCTLRFPGFLNSDLRKMAVNLVPYSRLHFFMIGEAPLVPKDAILYKQLKFNELLYEIYSPKNMMCAADPRHGRYLTSSITFRGEIPSGQVDDYSIAPGKNSSYFVQWIPNNIKYTICKSPQSNIKSSATFIGNSTSIRQLFDRIGNKFRSMFARKAFTHTYVQEGLDQDQFGQAYQNMGDLCHEYQIYQDATIDEYEQNNEQEQFG